MGCVSCVCKGPKFRVDKGGLRELRLQGFKVSCGQWFIPCRYSHTNTFWGCFRVWILYLDFEHVYGHFFRCEWFCLFWGVLRPTRDFFYTWGDATITGEDPQKFYLYSALITIEEWGFFRVQNLLWHGATFIMVISEDPRQSENSCINRIFSKTHVFMEQFYAFLHHHISQTPIEIAKEFTQNWDKIL